MIILRNGIKNKGDPSAFRLMKMKFWLVIILLTSEL